MWIDNKVLSNFLDSYKCPQCNSSIWHFTDIIIFCVASSECTYHISKPEFIENLLKGKMLIFNPSSRSYFLVDCNFKI
jgi:hypothetical protein